MDRVIYADMSPELAKLLADFLIEAMSKAYIAAMLFLAIDAWFS